MSKYVAFLDILGFKKKLQQLGQDAAKQYISAFIALLQWYTNTNYQRKLNEIHEFFKYYI